MRSDRAVVRAGPALAVCLLATLSGCSLLPGPLGPPDSDPALTVTPATVPEEAPGGARSTEPGSGSPPGTSAARAGAPAGALADGVDPEAVALAHRGALRSRNFSARLVRRIVGPGGELAVTVREVEAAPAYDRYLLERRVRRRPGVPSSVAVPIRIPNLSYWRDGPDGTVRRVVDGEVRYAPASTESFRVGTALTDPTGAARVRATLAAFGDLMVTATDGATIVTGGQLDRPERLPVPPVLSDPRRAWLRMRISERGVVVRYALQYRADVAGTNRTVGVHLRVTVDALEGPVRPPAWLPAARNATATGGGARNQARLRISSATRWANADVERRSPPSIWRSMS